MASQLPRSASFNRSHNVEAVAMRKAFCQLEFSRRHDAREVPERIQTPSNHRPLQHTGPRFVQSSQPDCAMASQPSRPTVIDQNSKFGILLRGSARPAPRYRRSRHRATTPTKAVEHAKQVPHFDANRKSIAAAAVTTSGNLRPQRRRRAEVCQRSPAPWLWTEADGQARRPRTSTNAFSAAPPDSRNSGGSVREAWSQLICVVCCRRIAQKRCNAYRCTEERL